MNFNSITYEIEVEKEFFFYIDLLENTSPKI